MDLLIRGGVVVTADFADNADVAVDGGRIAAICRPGVLRSADRVLDASGMLVMPGLIDPHTHMAHPFNNTVSRDDFYTGTLAAAYGGNTTIIDFAIQRDKDPMETILTRRQAADGNVVIDYSLHSCLTKSTQTTVDAVRSVIQYGIPSFKLYMIYRKQGRMVDDAVLLKVLQASAPEGGLVGVHAENAAIAEFNEEAMLAAGNVGPQYFPLSKPNIVEAECINRAIFLNEYARSNLYIFHLSTREGFSLVRQAKARGERVVAETCTHYLALTDDCYKRQDGINFVCSPPLRSSGDGEALWAALRDETLSVVSSDHCCFDRAQKLLGDNDFTNTPNGLPGVECRFPVLFSEGVVKGRISMARFVSLVSTNPAKIFGLYPRKGAIAVGSDADMILVDPSAEWTIGPDTLHTQCDWSPFDGLLVTGKVVSTISRGNMVIENGVFKGQKGSGRFLVRPVGQGRPWQC